MSIQTHITYNTDSDGKRVSQWRGGERHVVYNNKIVLNEIPDGFHGVKLSYNNTAMNEVKSDDANLEQDDFLVDYSTGVIFFHDSQEGRDILVNEYYGIGFVSYPSSRIYTNIENGEITETLHDVVSAQVKQFHFSTDAPPSDKTGIKEGSVWFQYDPNI